MTLKTKIKNWMRAQNKNDYKVSWELSSTKLGEDASAVFNFENGSDEDEICFEAAIEIIEEWESNEQYPEIEIH